MELSKSFLEDLKLIDQTLDAFFDSSQDSICVWTTRAGKKDLAFVVNRETGELYPELERRAIRKLHESDIWRRYGDAKSYERKLQEKEDEYRAKKKLEWEAKRQMLWREHRTEIRHAMENAKSGVLSGPGKTQEKTWEPT